jgi:hypothetical protein
LKIHRRFIGSLVAATIVGSTAFSVAACGGNADLRQANSNARCVVPDLTRAKLRSASKRLQRAGCKLGKVEINAGRARFSQVIEQRPKAGALRQPETSVDVVAVEINPTSGRPHGRSRHDWSALLNKSFVVLSVRDRNGPKPPIARPMSVHVSFTLVGLLHRSLFWQANCNDYNYRLRSASSRLVTSKEINTAMACPGRPSQEDAWLDGFFRSNPRWRLSRGYLKLVAGNRVIRLQRLRGRAQPTRRSAWMRCHGHPRRVRNVQVSELPCLKAKKAIRRGKFEVTPGGLLFSTRGFRCESPVGAPHDEPRFTLCRKRHRAFRFYGP